MTSADHAQPASGREPSRDAIFANFAIYRKHLSSKPDSTCRMWIQVLILCLSCLSRSEQQRPSPRRPGDQAGQCQYTFTVTSPVEASCSGGGVKPELDGLLSRLTLLEALVSRLLAGVEGGSGTGAAAEATGEEVLQEAYTQVTLERNQLEQEKEGLSARVLELQRRLEEQVREAESLRRKPCPQTHASGGSQLQDRPARGTCITEKLHVSRPVSRKISL